MQNSPKGKNILVICVDRDNDLGEKAGITGPIIGRKNNISAANALALADPEDSDVNALFKALQAYDTLKNKGDAEIVTLTGDKHIGMESDHEILRQLEEILKEYPAEEAVLVTDGAEDENVAPILRTKIKIVYPKRVIIKQNEGLENTYYMIYEFTKKILNDKKASRFFIGIPAIALLIYALFGDAGWRMIIGTVGIYLLIKGFQLENIVEKITSELVTSVKTRKASFFMYLVGLAFLATGVLEGYSHVTKSGNEHIVYSILNFLNVSIAFIFISALFFGWGSIYGRKKPRLEQYITHLSITFSIALITYTITKVMLTNSSHVEIIYSIIIGGILLTISSIIEKREKSMPSDK